MRVEQIGKITFILGDCMEVLKDNLAGSYDLAIVDTPYGINRDGAESGKNWKKYKKKGWDSKRPDKRYFDLLFSISKNQIIWGANYFTKFLPPSMGWVYWDKGQKLTMSDGELAFTSFERALRSIMINRCKIGESGGNIHPTQKPVKLYKWLLLNYAKEGDRILDTHGGSGSIAIACYDLDFELTIIEKDEEYFNNMLKRFKTHISQLTLNLK